MSLGMGSDVEIVEAAYRLTPNPQDWLRGVLERCGPRLFDGLGGFATMYRRDAPTPAEMVSPYVVLGADTRITTALRAAFVMTDAATRRRAFTIGRPIATLTDLHDQAPSESPLYAELAREVGFGDVVTVNAYNPDGTGCFLSAPLRRSVRAPVASRWARIAAHVAAGLRLQNAIRLSDVRHSAEAILAPDGRVMDASAHAAPRRELLRSVVRAIDRARAGRKKSSPDPLAAWTALVDGRWSLVDFVESDGRRLVLAVPNAPSAVDPRRLTAEQRVVAAYVARGDSNKLIAYTLGLPPGTVATRTRAAFRKLGVRTRAAFVDRYLTVLASDYDRLSVGGERLIVGEVSAPSYVDVGLTAAETAVALLVARGLSNAQIARARGTSASTVANQLERVYRALGVSSRAELAARLKRTRRARTPASPA